jgi:hypothetical protein
LKHQTNSSPYANKRFSASGHHFVQFLKTLPGLGVTFGMVRSWHDLSPTMPIEHPVDGRLGHLVAHQGFKSPLDFTHNEHTPMRSLVQETQKKLWLLVMLM